MKNQIKQHQKIGVIVFLLLAGLVLVMPVNIQAEQTEPAIKKETVERRQGLELFLGNSQDGEENNFSLGLTYEYRLNTLFGIGGIVEYAGINIEEWVLAVPLFLHPYKGWLFQAAPGVSITENEGEKEFLFRVGAAYEFEIQEIWTISPEFNVDFVDSREVFVYGVSFGYKF